MEKAELIELYSKVLQEGNYSPCTEKSYLHHLSIFIKFFGTRNISDIDIKSLSRYFTYLKRERDFSYPCMKQSLAAIHFLFTEVLKKDIDFHSFFKMKGPNFLPLILTPVEVKRIIDSTNNLKHKTIISTIYSCGLKVSELINLEKSHIDLVTRTIKIIDTKGKIIRRVMLSDKLLLLLSQYFKEYRPNRYLFIGKKGGKYSARSIDEIFSKSLKSAGIPKKVSVRTLRHSFAAHLLDNGIDIHLVQELLGHKHLAATQIYNYIHPRVATNIKSPLDLIGSLAFFIFGSGLYSSLCLDSIF